MNIFDITNKVNMKASIFKSYTFNLFVKKQITLLICFFSFEQLNAQLCFNPVSNFTINTNPSSVTSADFNGDGFKDLATANGNSNNVSILLGNGNGNFGAATNFTLGVSPVSIISADFNGDSKADLALGNSSSGSSSISILLGTGTGSFGSSTNFAGGGFGNTISLISSDFNKDGIADLATVNYGISSSTGSISILLGTGSGSFGTATNLSAGVYPSAIISQDFNNDTNLDLAVTNSNSGNVSIRLGDGTGGFSGNNNFSAGGGPWSITSADFNGDGFKDLAIANALVSGNVSVLLGTGTGSFGAVNNFTSDSGSMSITNADFNGDGFKDLAVANSTANNVSILLGTGNGSFVSSTNFIVGTNPGSIISMDFNGDGKIDLGTANSSNNVSVLLNCSSNGVKTDETTKANTVYPNPTNGQITIGIGLSEKQNIQIFDSTGQLVFNQTVSGVTNIDVSNLNPGTYNIIVKTGNDVTNKRLVISK